MYSGSKFLLATPEESLLSHMRARQPGTSPKLSDVWQYFKGMGSEALRVYSENQGQDLLFTATQSAGDIFLSPPGYVVLERSGAPGSIGVRVGLLAKAHADVLQKVYAELEARKRHDNPAGACVKAAYTEAAELCFPALAACVAEQAAAQSTAAGDTAIEGAAAALEEGVNLSDKEALGEAAEATAQDPAGAAAASQAVAEKEDQATENDARAANGEANGDERKEDEASAAEANAAEAKAAEAKEAEAKAAEAKAAEEEARAAEAEAAENKMLPKPRRR